LFNGWFCNIDRVKSRRRKTIYSEKPTKTEQTKKTARRVCLPEQPQRIEENIPSKMQIIERLIATLCLNGTSSEGAIIFWMINIESLREIQQVSAFNLIADVPVFRLSKAICLIAGFAILTELNLTN